MLSYKLIKRKYKLTDENIADFFGYRSRISFFTSTLKDYLITQMERVYDRYATDGLKGSADYIQLISFPGPDHRKKRYKDGLIEFIDTIHAQEKKGKVRDPLANPNKKKKKYTVK